MVDDALLGTFFIDGYGNIAPDDTTLIYTMYRLWDNPGYWDFHASGFSIFSPEGSYEPIVISIQYWVHGTCSGLGSMLYIKDGTHFRRVGSMIAYASGGGYARLQPLINEYGDIIVYVHAMGNKLFYAVDSEGNFETVGDWMEAWFLGEITIFDREMECTTTLTTEAFYEALATGQMQQFFFDFPNGNFVPLGRMYNLEQHIVETIPQMLRETSPPIRLLPQPPIPPVTEETDPHADTRNINYLVRQFADAGFGVYDRRQRWLNIRNSRNGAISRCLQPACLHVRRFRAQTPLLLIT